MTQDNAQFTWRVGSRPPVIESHSNAKLSLLEGYLDRYFDIVCATPQMERFRITLVDAFCGGGLFTHQGEDRLGSPLVMIDAVRRAEERLNRRRGKPLTIDAQFVFVDRSASAIEHLRHALDRTGLGEWASGRIHIRNTTASSAIPELVEAARKWTPRTGRSIFLFDQCGYSDVRNHDVRVLYHELPKSEVIVTYAFGAIYDYMTESSEFLAGTAPIELQAEELRDLLKSKEHVRVGRYFAGRLLGQHLQNRVGSQYASRFFLRSERSGRDMWLVHYSKVRRSRLAMNDAHWSVQNSITQGDAGLDMVGFVPRWEDDISFDFGFKESDAERMQAALMSEFPHLLERFDIDDAPTFDTLLSSVANGAAATEDQIQRALNSLHGANDVEILTPSGANMRPNSLILPTHRIRLARQRKLIL
ncbi:MAG: three-Cys-motif partner protein TcmP [Rhodospirillaceae bacterium]|nr:three-Cys-motif partner protein TcmP [Rhodospirillaceae bacterium]